MLFCSYQFVHLAVLTAVEFDRQMPTEVNECTELCGSLRAYLSYLWCCEIYRYNYFLIQVFYRIVVCWKLSTVVYFGALIKLTGYGLHDEKRVLCQTVGTSFLVLI